MSTATEVTIGRRRVPLSNADKVLYPSGFTKGQVVEYYRQIAPAMLPHLKNRAVTLKRYPNGTEAPFFFEKRCPGHKPDWIKTATIVGNSSAGPVEHCLLNDAASLVWAANLAALELHVPLGKAAAPDLPTLMVFDLDPGAPANMVDCARVALHMRDMFAHLGLKSFAKTSGNKGLHVYVPLNTKVSFNETKSYARAIAELFQREDPKHITAVMSKSLRGGRVFIDWSQNDRHKTTACAYTLRAIDRPGVSTPVKWAEVEKVLSSKDPARIAFEADDVVKRVAKEGDLFAEVLTLKQKLPKGV